MPNTHKPPSKRDPLKEYLFQEHSEEFLSSWVRQLQYFRFFRAIGGHANDFDKIDLALRYNGQEDLIHLLHELHISYQYYNEKPPQPEVGKPYSSDEFSKFPSLIPGTRWLAQPNRQRVNGIEIFVFCKQDLVEFSIIGSNENNWSLTKTEFEQAQQLEPVFEKFADRVIDPPFDSKNYICPKYYPQYWQE